MSSSFNDDAVWRRYGKGPEIKPRDFKLRSDERGVSCNLKSKTTIDQTLGSETASAIAEADVRDVQNVGLVVECTPLEENPAHCEIISTPDADLHDLMTRERLAQVFRKIYPS